MSRHSLIFETFVNPVPCLPQVDNVCKAVTHNIITECKKVLSVYLIHSLPLKMSAIQVFVKDKMAVVAHLVGKDTIGYEANLEIDQQFKHLPWRAMIIKDNQGQMCK